MKLLVHSSAAPLALVPAAAKIALWAVFALIAAPAVQGADYTLVRSFGFADQVGQSPRAPLLRASDGAFYGTAYGGATDPGAVFRINQGSSGYQTLHRFGSVSNDGAFPTAGLLEASDGALYGTTSRGGVDYGTVFKVNKDGSGYSVLHLFAQYGDGQNPQAGLVEGTDGALYGTTYGGGSSFVGGTIFKINKDGSGYTNLYAFTFLGADGSFPHAGLLKASDGMLYGTTERGGAHTGGTLFKLNEDGSGFSVLHNFSSIPNDGVFPHGALLEASDGWLYGTTQLGGTTNSGTVYKLQKDGSGYTVLHSFNIYSADESYPECALVEGADGALYGTASSGDGTVFKLNKDGSGYRILHSFTFANADGTYPLAGLALGAGGVLYGTTSSGGSNGLGTIFKLNQDGSGYGIVYDFSIAGGDALNPQTAALLEARDGFLYGTTPVGGGGICNLGCGALFRVSKDGSAYSLVHVFTSTAPEGYTPNGGIIQGPDGSFYGTTSQGGSGNSGTVFKLDTGSGTLSILHSFTSTNADGQSPAGELLLASDGALYGTTGGGGTNYSGTIFRLGTNGSDYALLHQFTPSAGDGASPASGLIEGRDGALYGTTSSGGLYGDFGSVFKLNKDGTGYHILHNFNYDGTDAIRPVGALFLGADGALYGTTPQGGTNNSGTVFRLNEDGSDYRVLHSFNYFGPDGQNPLGALTQASDGALYGTAAYGGSSGVPSAGCGTIFRLSADGARFSTLYAFVSDPDGCNPRGALLRATDSRLYGTTTEGGQLGMGTLFSIAVAPPPIVCPSNLDLSADPGQCSKSNVTFSISASPGTVVIFSPPSGSTFPVGTTTVTCTATNASSGIAQSCSFLVTVVDNQPPVIAGESAIPAVLWPPDHKMVDVFVGYEASDNCLLSSTSLTVTSSEPVNNAGDGNTSPDWQVVDAHHLRLRAERSGQGNGRLYTITITAIDSAQNSSTQALTVVVPKDEARRR